MTNSIRFRSMLVAASLLAGAAACTQKSETREESDRAAKDVKVQVEDLKEESRDLAESGKESGNAELVERDLVGDDRLPDTAAPRTDTVVGRAADKGLDEVADDAKDVGKNARELADASNEFKYRKMVRINTLRAVHSVHASQPNIINAMAQSFGLVEKDRGEVNEKLVIFQMRLDEAGNAIQSLELVEAADWETRNDATSKALDRVEDAGEEVWESLNEADRTTGDRTSMR